MTSRLTLRLPRFTPLVILTLAPWLVCADPPKAPRIFDENPQPQPALTPKDSPDDQQIAVRWNDTTWVKTQADAGNAYACAIMAENYIRGENGCERNDEAAKPYMEFALAAKHPIAIYLRWKNAFDKREKKGMDEFRFPASEALSSYDKRRFKPDPRWLCNMATLAFVYGEIGAESRFMQPASMGYSRAQEILFSEDVMMQMPSSAYNQTLLNIAQSCLNSSSWNKQDSSMVGNVHALLGEAYLGIGRINTSPFVFDHQKGIHHLHMAAKEGNVFALIALADAYYTGRVVEVSPQIAKAYLIKAQSGLARFRKVRDSARTKAFELSQKLASVAPSDVVGIEAESGLQVDAASINSPDRVKNFGLQKDTYLRCFLDLYTQRDAHKDLIKLFDASDIVVWGRRCDAKGLLVTLQNLPAEYFPTSYRVEGFAVHWGDQYGTGLQAHVVMDTPSGVANLYYRILFKRSYDGTRKIVRWDTWPVDDGTGRDTGYAPTQSLRYEK